MLMGSQMVALLETILDWCLVTLGKTQLDVANEIAAELKLSTQPQLCLIKPEPLSTPRDQWNNSNLLKQTNRLHGECRS